MKTEYAIRKEIKSLLDDLNDKEFPVPNAEMRREIEITVRVLRWTLRKKRDGLFEWNNLVTMNWRLKKFYIGPITEQLNAKTILLQRLSGKE